MASSNNARKRINILQSGFRNFVGGVKIPLSADSKWLLEAVCIDQEPQQPALNADIFLQAQFFLDNILWKHQEVINDNKQKWISTMKN